MNPFREWFRRPELADIALPEQEEETPQQVSISRPGRPISAALAAVVQALEQDPHVEPAEVSERFGVSRDYARTLLRRARARRPQASAQRAAVAAQSNDIDERLARLERDFALLAAGGSRELSNVNKRTQVLALHAQGLPPATIADRLHLPLDEVQFTLRVAPLTE